MFTSSQLKWNTEVFAPKLNRCLLSDEHTLEQGSCPKLLIFVPIHTPWFHRLSWVLEKLMIFIFCFRFFDNCPHTNAASDSFWTTLFVVSNQWCSKGEESCPPWTSGPGLWGTKVTATKEPDLLVWQSECTHNPNDGHSIPNGCISFSHMIIHWMAHFIFSLITCPEAVLSFQILRKWKPLSNSHSMVTQ